MYWDKVKSLITVMCIRILAKENKWLQRFLRTKSLNLWNGKKSLFKTEIHTNFMEVEMEGELNIKVRLPSSILAIIHFGEMAKTL